MCLIRRFTLVLAAGLVLSWKQRMTSSTVNSLVYFTISSYNLNNSATHWLSVNMDLTGKP